MLKNIDRFRPLGQKEFFLIVQNENVWNSDRLVWKHLPGTFKIIASFSSCDSCAFVKRASVTIVLQ